MRTGHISGGYSFVGNNRKCHEDMPLPVKTEKINNTPEKAVQKNKGVWNEPIAMTLNILLGICMVYLKSITYIYKI